MNDFIMQNPLFIYLPLALIVFVLSIYLGIILNRLRLQKRKHDQTAAFLENKNQERHLYRVESIKTICLATIQHQCEISEACIRIKKLLEFYPEIESKSDYQVLQEMYEQIKDFDVLESRNALTKQQKFQQDNRRFAIEERFKQRMLSSLKKLHQEIQGIKDQHYSLH